MVASHNEDSVKFVIEEMRRAGVDIQSTCLSVCVCDTVCCRCVCSHCLTRLLADGGVSFGQLLGMCDHVSFPLAARGYRVYKYVPYGPLRQVMPYLVRRAQENSDFLGRAGKERRLLKQAILNRLMP